MRLTRNPKILAGASILITSSSFMLAADASLHQIPLPILIVQLAALIVGSSLLLLGFSEEKKPMRDSPATFAGSSPNPDSKSILKTTKV
jgi:hypothetical protein